MKVNEIGEIPIKGILGQGLLKEIPHSKELAQDRVNIGDKRSKK